MMMLLFRLKVFFRPVLIVACLTCSASFAVASDSVMNKIKSVYIYNFLSFIQWPDPVVPMREYQLCMAADQEFINNLKTVVVNETLGGLPLLVTPFYDRNLTIDCHLLFIQNNMEVDPMLLNEMSQSGTLILGDAVSFASQDFGMIGFETRGRKVRVAVNLTRLQGAGFKVSSKLLRVVRIVR